MKIGIVTGASSGIGREFAVQLPKAYALDELWLIGRKQNLLEETASRVDNAKTRIVPMDLTSREGMDNLKKRIQEEPLQIGVLVNNAGFSHIGAFGETPMDLHMNMIDLNVRVLTELTHLCLPFMDAGSVLFQVASISGYMPGPNTAVYSATKAFVVNFSQALNKESKGKNIHVITVSPGPVDTLFWDVASEGSGGVPKNAAKPSDVVGRAIRDAKKKKLNSTFGVVPKLYIFLSKVLSRKMLLALSAS